MNSAVRVRLKLTEEQKAHLVALQVMFARACNSLAEVVQRTRCWNRVTLHHLTYKDLRAQFPELGRHAIVQKIVAGYDGDRRGAVFVAGAQAAQEAQPIDQRHPQVEDDRVRLVMFSLEQSFFRADRGSNRVAFQAQHSREGLCYPFIIVNNQDF